MRIFGVVLACGLTLALAVPAQANEPSRPQPSGLTNTMVSSAVSRTPPTRSTTRQATPRRPARAVTSPRDPASGQAAGIRSPRDAASGMATGRR